MIHKRFVEISSRFSTRLSNAIETNGPVKLARRNDTPLCDVLCRVVAGQQLSTKAASTIWGRIVASAGAEPLSRYLTDVNIDVLRSCGLSNSKALSMKAIMSAHREGMLDADTLRRQKHAARSSQLTSIRGVGQWTADMTSLFYFGDKDVWPETDVTVWKTLHRLTDKRRSLRRTADLFAPHRSYLALYMYRIADGPN